MKTEYEIPKDATHYFLWWDGVHVYKKDGEKWFWLINGEWFDAPNEKHIKITWFFGYRQIAHGYKHKLHKITYAV